MSPSPLGHALCVKDINILFKGRRMSTTDFIDSDAEARYWNSICELHKVASADDPFPCITGGVPCCPMNAVLRDRTVAIQRMRDKGYTHAVWAVYKDDYLSAIPMCSLVWLTQPPSDAVLHEIFEDRLIRYSPARTDCADDCYCRTHMAAVVK